MLLWEPKLIWEIYKEKDRALQGNGKSAERCGIGFIDGRPRAEVQVALNALSQPSEGVERDGKKLVKYLNPAIPICSHDRVTVLSVSFTVRKTYST